MKNYFFLLTFLLLSLAFKCERLPSFNLDEPFEMKVGDKRVNTKITTVIELKEVVEDSRCPKNVNCFWEGQVKIKISLVNESKVEQDFTLTLRDDRPRDRTKVVNGYSYELLAVDPYPEEEKKIQPEDYVVKVVVKKVEKK